MTLLRSGAATDTGLVRSVNQDLAVETSNLFAVADGMGGHAGGEVAARLAVDALSVAFGRQPTGAGLSEAVSEANAVVWQHSQENPELRGMGTTLTAVALVNEDGKDVLALVNVGDSRSYRFHDGELTQITTDHSLAEEMVRTGELTSVGGLRPPPSPHLDPRPGGGLGRGRRPVEDPAGPGRPLPPVQRRADQRAQLGPDQRGPLLGGGSPSRRPTCWSRRPGPTAAATTSPWWWSTSWWGRRATPPPPAVAAVAADFAQAGGARPGVHAGLGRFRRPGGPPEPPAPSRRERRRAKRRAKRVARGRRLVTIEDAAVRRSCWSPSWPAAFFAVRWYDTNSYFVRVDNNELVIYQGRIGGFLWYHPEQVERTRVTTADVPAIYLESLKAGVQESSVASARTCMCRTWSPPSTASRIPPIRPARSPGSSTTTAPPRRPLRPAPPRPRGGPDGEADPAPRHLHGALLRRPVHPAEQHPGPEGQLPGQQPGQSPDHRRSSSASPGATSCPRTA